jgi:hypothetical protein
MADLQTRPRAGGAVRANGVWSGLVSNAIFYVLINWGVPTVIAIAVAFLGYLKGLPLYGLCLVAITAFLLVLLTVYVLKKVVIQSNTTSPALVAGKEISIAVNPTINPIISPVISPVITQAPVIQQRIEGPEEQRPSPRFTAKEARLLRSYIDFREGQEYAIISDQEWRVGINEALQPVHVALIRFYYEPDLGVRPFLYVRAHIFVYAHDGTCLAQLYKTIWFNNSERSITFNTANDHELLVAVIPEGSTNKIVLFEHHQKEVHKGYRATTLALSPTPRICTGEEFRLTIQLVGKYHNNVEYKGAFEVPLTLVPGHRIGTVRLLTD